MLSASDDTASSTVSFDSLAPGEIYEFKDGWSMSNLDDLKFKINIDGLAGGSVTFTK